MNTISDADKVKVYERFLHDINLYLMTCNDKKLSKLLHNADMWSYAHRSGNGELSDDEQQARIDSNFHNLCKVD